MRSTQISQQQQNNNKPKATHFGRTSHFQITRVCNDQKFLQSSVMIKSFFWKSCMYAPAARIILDNVAVQHKL